MKFLSLTSIIFGTINVIYIGYIYILVAIFGILLLYLKASYRVELFLILAFIGIQLKLFNII